MRSAGETMIPSGPARSTAGRCPRNSDGADQFEAVRFQSINGRVDVVDCEGYVAQSQLVGWRSLRSLFVDGFVKLAELQLGAAVGCLQHDHFGPDVVRPTTVSTPVARHDLRLSLLFESQLVPSPHRRAVLAYDLGSACGVQIHPASLQIRIVSIRLRAPILLMAFDM
jgi:hypothetical protein